MSKKANPTIVGLFFAIGLALAVTGLLIFSSRSLFHPQHKTIVYFNASLKGLNPGAPVKFRGVTIGSVVDILIRHNQAATDFSNMVPRKYAAQIDHPRAGQAISHCLGSIIFRAFPSC